MAVLPTNYLDDILAASMGGKRRFRITHEDGSTEEVTLEDVSEYEQVGSPFGSGDVNKTNQAVNEKLDSADVVDPALATVLGFAADAKLTGDALSELNKNCLQGTVRTLLSNKFIENSNQWIGVDISDISQYKFLNFNFTYADKTADQEVLKNITSYNNFKKSTATSPIMIVFNPWDSSDENKVMAYYVSDTHIALYRGSKCHQYYRVTVHGIN